MAKTRNIKKQLICMEDIAQGVGSVQQDRAQSQVTVHKVDIPFAISSVADMQALDIAKYTRARVYDSDGVQSVDYVYDPNATTGISSNTGAGRWVGVTRAAPTDKPTFEELAASPVAILGTIVTTSGYSSQGDGGANDLLIVPPLSGTLAEGYFDLPGSGNQAKGLFPLGYVELKQFGPDYTGGTDTSTRINAALKYAANNGLPVVGRSAVYLFASNIQIPNNSVLDLDHTVLFKKQGLGIRIENEGWPSYGNNIHISGLSYTQVDSSVSNRGDMIHLFADNLYIEDSIIVNIAEEDAIGAWSMYLSGSTGWVKRCYIDSRAAGLFGDGIHCASLQDFTIGDSTILAGDDALAFFFPPPENSQPGRNLASRNVTAENLILGSADANIIRIGASSSTGFAGDAPENCVWKGLTIRNIVDAVEPVMGSSGRRISISDRRLPADIADVHEGIVIENVSSMHSTVAGLISARGNPDESNVANLGQKNFKDITLRNLDMICETNGAVFFGGGIEQLVFDNCQFIRDFPATFQALDIRQVDSVQFKNGSYLKTSIGGATGPGCILRWIGKLDIFCSEFDGDGEFSLINIDTNAQQDTIVYCNHSQIHGAQRLFLNNDAVTPIAEMRIFADLYDAATKLSANMLTYSAGSVVFADQVLVENGINGSFTTTDAKTVTVSNGQIISIV